MKIIGRSGDCRKESGRMLKDDLGSKIRRKEDYNHGGKMGTEQGRWVSFELSAEGDIVGILQSVV